MGENLAWNRISLKPLCTLFTDFGDVFGNDSLVWSILAIAVPAALALAADPVASLIDTAFIGQLGAVDLAAVGVAIAVINQASKIAIFPLVSVTTSLVAEEEASDAMNNKPQQDSFVDFGSVESEETDELMGQAKRLNSSHSGKQRRHFPSATSALVVACVLGLIQALFLAFGDKVILNYMGISSNSPMLAPAQRYLVLRSLGSPAVLLSLAMQGVFRGLRDTKTPLYATLVGDVANVALDPIFIFGFRFGVSGAATAHVVSQYIIVIILLWKLNEHVDLLPPSIGDLQFKRFLGNGFLLLMRVIAATFCVTMATSLAARHGSTSMAAFQICLQIWLASSLLADGLAVAGQAMLASAFTRKDFNQAGAVASRVLQLAMLFGLGLCGILLIGLPVVSRLFTKDTSVLELVGVGIPFVAATQPVNVLAFVFDGVSYGASDFAFAAYSMMLVSLVSLLCLTLLSSAFGFVGIWIALTIFMSLRAVVGLCRIGSGTGPWNFLRS